MVRRPGHSRPQPSERPAATQAQDQVAVPLQPRSSASDIPTMPGFPPDGSAVPRHRQQRDPRPVQPATIGGPLNDAPSPEQLRLFARALMATALELHWLPGVPHSGNAAERPDQTQDDREGRDAGRPLTAQGQQNTPNRLHP
jgi:hypothetical protein